ncbi:2-keto-4-pentenoate hydratase [Pseudolysobacter antarcticus]|uniref:2-keto-4-pentenoate hydratase n=1 Tax=Pseudolysobacter antarcticus TaxID=2511995 RepID=A0A411HG27_9GAMM|nr:2-keto-4-pentenoate hydratase [Pseudolysobacter antarcticus]QBB69411.1 2-keto-4-pentenoate hydratase [Pseudolysobacter antarcticus]
MSETRMDSTDVDGAIAKRFVQARLAGVALDGFPGSIPLTLDAAYRCQSAAIQRWPDSIVGWKVGYIAAAQREPGGDDRLVGPIFARNLQLAQDGRSLEFPVFEGGFAAVEAEFVFRLGEDAPREKIVWSADEARAMVAEMYIGIETAGSPLATINALGPRVVVSDFGNNAGLLLGPKIAGGLSLAETELNCTMMIAEHRVGAGAASDVADGLLAALAFALSRCARNGRPLRAGDLITTGAVTGIHDIVSGQEALAEFGAYGAIRCRAVEARAFMQTRAAK